MTKLVNVLITNKETVKTVLAFVAGALTGAAVDHVVNNKVKVTLQDVIDDYNKNREVDKFEWVELHTEDSINYTGTVKFNGREFNFKINDSRPLSEMVGSHTVIALKEALKHVEIENASNLLTARLCLYMCRGF